MRDRLLAIVLGAVTAAIALSAWADEWDRGRIARLPDSAFAAIEVTPEGRNLRHLPHHDETGEVDVAHLRSARSRLSQVRWLDPAHGARARQHLEDHARELARTGRD